VAAPPLPALPPLAEREAEPWWAALLLEPEPREQALEDLSWLLDLSADLPMTDPSQSSLQWQGQPQAAWAAPLTTPPTALHALLL
jgi:hypothetical protein